ncbi:MAG TPA: hypothetical protein VGU43_04220, partial [Thermoplasmata archaeon]|nr:hypothetical protein [Thermoplasmata archaeon]
LPAGESYCVGASAVGFLPYYQCGLSPTVLAGTTSLPMSLATEGVALSFLGFPTGTKLHVNLSASAPPAESATLYGGPHFDLTLFPGRYQLTAWAPYLNGSGVYETPHPVNFSVRPGLGGPSLTLALLHELASAGTLGLPPGVNASLVQVRLTSPVLNLSVDGGSFHTRFLATPGSYVAYATAAVGNASYANLTTVTISSKGVVSPAISLLGAGTALIGTLVPPSGYALNNSSLPVTLVGPRGLTVSATALDGGFTAILPTGGSYRVYTAATISRLAPAGGMEFVTFAASGSTLCTLSGSTTPCSIPLTATVGLSAVAGSALGAGSTIRPDGSVTFVATNGERSTAALTDGRFSARLLPGTYTVYATGTGASTMLAALTNFTLGNGTSYLNLSMGAAYTDTLTLVSAVGGPPSANLSVSRAGFPVLRLVDEPMGTAIPLTLPAGTWSLAATSTANAYGVRTPSAAHANVVLLAGNAATTLSLSALLTSTVSIEPTGQLSATVPPGGTVRFTYSLVNTGSTPVSFHLLGSPVTWNITFLPRNFTLNPGPGGTSSSEAVVVLPAGTPVAHPPLIVEAIESNGTLLGASSLSPTVTVEPEPALSIGSNAKLSSIASDSITVPFWAFNSGNLAETVNFAVGDTARLAGLGWISSLRSGTSALTASVSLSAGQNASYSVVLGASGGHALPPGSVTVLATVTNGSYSLARDAQLPVPTLTVGISNGTIAVTGPSIGSPAPYPDWLVPVLVFVPALAFLVGAVSWRWWRTRRWVRK